VQAALLRVLQERRFERVGGTRSIAVDVRVIAATNRDLEAMVEEGTFRKDLYYRLNAVVIELPPLRERRDDVPALTAHLLSRIAEEQGGSQKQLSSRALRAIAAEPWPGNVRQLENALRAACLFSEGPVIDDTDLVAAGVRPSAGKRESVLPGAGAGFDDCYARLCDGELTLRDLKKEIERGLIERALSDSDGNISRAASLLGMKRPRLSQLVKEYGLLSGEES
jgi:DNA-binding NtrC family response regulator